MVVERSTNDWNEEINVVYPSGMKFLIIVLNGDKPISDEEAIRQAEAWALAHPKTV
jgi:hypothetical protein